MKCCFGVSHSHSDSCCLDTIPAVPISPACGSFTEPQRTFQPFTSPGDSLSSQSLPLTLSLVLCFFLSVPPSFRAGQPTFQQQTSVEVRTADQSTLTRNKLWGEQTADIQTMKTWCTKTLTLMLFYEMDSVFWYGVKTKVFQVKLPSSHWFDNS